MGSSLSQQLCCALCERCRQQEAADAEPSETKPILQSPGATRTFWDTQPPTPALKVPRQGSKDLSQDHRPSADALEENGEPGSAAEGWEPAWNPMDFFVLPADEEVEGEAEDLTQQEKVSETEEEMKPAADVPVGDTALGAELGAGAEEQPQAPGQPGSEGAPRAGLALQEGNILVELSSEAGPTLQEGNILMDLSSEAGPTLQEGNVLMELSSEAGPGQGCETDPPADTMGVLMGRDLSLCAVQVAGPEPTEGTDRAKAAETSPQSAQRAELTCLVEATSLLTLQSPSELIARGVAELYSASAVSWQPLCPQWGSLEPPNQLLQLLKQGMQGTVPPAQGTGSLCCAGLAGLREILQQPQDGALWELGQEGSRGCTPGPEAELQHGIMQPAVELPEDPATFVPVQQEAELPHVPSSLPQVLGSSGEREAENIGA